MSEMRFCRNVILWTASHISESKTAVRNLCIFKPLTEFDVTLLGRIITNIEALGRTEIKVTFFGGYTISQEIEKT